jgi:predicted  nucleic acid-binding Zn-ribbon protein
MQPDATNAADQIKRDIDSVRRDMTELIRKVSFTSLRDETSDLDTSIANYPMRIQKIRERKYTFNRILESEALDFQKQWALKRGMVQNQVSLQANNLQAQLRPLESRVASLSLGASSPILVKTIMNEVESFETRVSSAESSLRELFSSLKQEFEKSSGLVDQIERALDQCESASFGFLPGECICMASKAVWTRDNREDKEDPEGILFLTDQRLLFEQREEIAKKKVLFITTEREKIQKLQFETPVEVIENIKATRQGLFKNEDWLEFQLPSGSFAREVKLHLDGGDCNLWQQMINRIKSGDIETDRALEVDKNAVEKARSAPAKCPSCGGAITKPVLRGMDSITCDFCGAVIRL